jgi:hypothetical protein
MKVVGSFNKISDKLKQELIKPMPKGKAVNFQLLNGSYDPNLKREVYGASKSLRLRDTIFDPYLKDDSGKEVGGLVDIGVVSKIKDGRVEKCKKYWVEALANGIPGNGQFSLSSGSISDIEVYEFLCLSNGREDNPYRSTDQLPQYRIVDVDAVNKAAKEKELKELRARVTRLAKDNPTEAKTLADLLPKDEDKK